MSIDSNSEISALRNQLFIQLIALVLVTGTLTVYLYRQASMEGKALAQAKQVVDGYRQAEPNMVNIINGLVAYGQRHPDYAQQVLKKYGIVPPPPGTPIPPLEPKR
jgi:hypothetical protein